jgi:hypothetical protein
VVAYETIGYQWYQWNSSGDSDPDKTCDIKVVVYWNESVDVIKEKYPVDPKGKEDYRYLTYEAAVKYLDAAIAEMPDAKNLIATRNQLRKPRNN